MKRICLFLALSLWLVPAQDLGAEVPRLPNWQDVGPIFKKRCINCHSELGAANELRLDSYAAVLAGGKNGAVVLAGDSGGSELIRRLRGESAPRMPFLSTPLPPDDLDLIMRWIDAGLPEIAAPE